MSKFGSVAGRGRLRLELGNAICYSGYRELLNWTREAGILTFVFEAFDEPWKGSPDPLEPEKHWGLFTVDRMPKLVMRDLYSNLLLN